MKVSIFITLILFVLSSFSQSSKDTIGFDSSAVLIWKNSFYEICNSKQDYDTSLYLLNTLEPLQNIKCEFASLGNIGLAHYSMLNFYSNHQLFNIRQQLYSTYWLSTNDNIDFVSVKPFSEIKYQSGGKEENFLDFSFFAPYSNFLTLKLDYRVISSTGVFYHQKSNNNHFKANLNYKSFDNKFNTKFYYVRNSVKTEENCGILNDYLYEDTTYSRLDLIPVHEYNQQNILLDNSFRIANQYFLGKTDSLQMNKIGSIFFDILYSSSNRLDTISDSSSYYTNNYFQTNFTRDILHQNEFNTFFGWSNFNNNSVLNFKSYLNFQKIRYFVNSIYDDFLYMNFGLIFKFDFKNLHIANESVYKKLIQDVDQFNIGDKNYHSNTILQLKVDRNLIIKFENSIDYFTPNFEFISLKSNHYFWFKPLNNSINLITTANFDWNGVLLSYENSILQNYVYIDERYNPIQSSKSININKFTLFKRLSINGFEVTPKVIYSNSSNSMVISLPEIYGRLNFNYTFSLFKKALILSPGFDVVYFSPYFARIYNPSIGSFISQSAKKTENQYNIDLFIALNIKKARILLMYSNISEIFDDHPYYQVLHNPQKGGVFRFGINWRFFD